AYRVHRVRDTGGGDLAHAHADNAVEPCVLRRCRLEDGSGAEVVVVSGYGLAPRAPSDHLARHLQDAAVPHVDERIGIRAEREAHVELRASVRALHQPIAATGQYGAAPEWARKAAVGQHEDSAPPARRRANLLRARE